MSFVKRFQASLESLYPPVNTSEYVIAYSGGLDSHVLLYCFKQTGAAVRAVHVHHGLQTVADDWVEHCRQICKQLDVPLDVLYVDAQQKPGASPEESARNARYQALHDNLAQGECLVTAQHLNDQAETLLLQLFRTASAAGLSAMPAYRQFGDYAHIRPLLAFSRQEIEAFAKKNDMHWIEDPSNQDISFDRNYLRKEVFPILEKRWPAVSTQLSKVSELQSGNLQVLEDMAAIDMADAVTIQKGQAKACTCEVLSMLCIAKLAKLSSARLLNLLRYWVMTALAQQPSRKLLEEIESALLNSQMDANPEIRFSGYTFRKYQGKLYLLQTKNTVEINSDIEWVPSSDLVLPALDIKIRVVDSTGQGLNRNLLDKTLKLRFRRGGEKFHPAGRRHSQRLKKLLQEANIPPWERGSVPLLYFNDELIAVVGFWVCKQYSVAAGEVGWLPEIEKVS